MTKTSTPVVSSLIFDEVRNIMFLFSALRVSNKNTADSDSDENSIEQIEMIFQEMHFPSVYASQKAR